jgi:phospholipid/cholesterol/gamma-HCH transport system substrate-binding protein
MEREANYAAVGAFVLLVLLLAVLFVYWYSEKHEHRSYDRYEIYFSGSVSGLDKGAAVRYLGVGVGRVIAMHIDPRDSSRVEVVVDIDATTPISEHTVAQLGLQGVTGLLYIDLGEGRTDKRLAPPVASLEYPVIRAAPSNFDVFLTSLPELVAAAGSVAQRASLLLSDANLRAVSGALGNIEQASGRLPQTMRDLSALAAELRGASGDIAAAARGARGVVTEAGPELASAVRRLRTVADHLANASTQLDRIIAENRADIRSFTRGGLPEIERFAREGREAAADIRALSNSLRENPAQLLYQPPERGVEIPR